MQAGTFACYSQHQMIADSGSLLRSVRTWWLMMAPYDTLLAVFPRMPMEVIGPQLLLCQATTWASMSFAVAVSGGSLHTQLQAQLANLAGFLLVSVFGRVALVTSTCPDIELVSPSDLGWIESMAPRWCRAMDRWVSRVALSFVSFTGIFRDGLNMRFLLLSFFPVVVEWLVVKLTSGHFLGFEPELRSAAWKLVLSVLSSYVYQSIELGTWEERSRELQSRMVDQALAMLRQGLEDANTLEEALRSLGTAVSRLQRDLCGALMVLDTPSGPLIYELFPLLSPVEPGLWPLDSLDRIRLVGHQKDSAMAGSDGMGAFEGKCGHFLRLVPLFTLAWGPFVSVCPVAHPSSSPCRLGQTVADVWREPGPYGAAPLLPGCGWLPDAGLPRARGAHGASGLGHMPGPLRGVFQPPQGPASRHSHQHGPGRPFP